MIGKIGCRAHDYGHYNIETFCKLITLDGYQTIQLALKKALTEISELNDHLTVDFAAYLSEHLNRFGLEVSVLGVYLNYAHPDEYVQEENLRILRGHIEIAEELGCRMIGTETGSLDASYKAHVDNHGKAAYERFREAVACVMDLVAEKNTYMAVEAVSHHIIHTPERMMHLVQDINHERLKVIFDITNMMTWENHHKQDEIITYMFEQLEDRIWTVHIKDFKFVDNRKVIVPIGEGLLNLDLLMRHVKDSKQTVDVLAENIEHDKLRETFQKLNIYI